MKTGTVTAVHGCKSFNGQHGTIFYHKIELDNGDIGEIGKKSEGAVKVGDSITYEITATEYGNKIKQIQPQNGFNGGGFKGQSRGSSASFALSYAKDLAVANIAANNAPLALDAIAEKVLTTATRFNQWLKENE